MNERDFENERYVVPDATVWLNSGSPPLKVLTVEGVDIKFVRVKTMIKKSITFAARIECFTPEPTPNQND